jgi:hypothetical protein
MFETEEDYINFRTTEYNKIPFQILYEPDEDDLSIITLKVIPFPQTEDDTEAFVKVYVDGQEIKGSNFRSEVVKS